MRGEQIISVESGELNLDKLGTGYQVMEIEKMVDSVMESSVIGQGLGVNGPLGLELYHAGCLQSRLSYCSRDSEWPLVWQELFPSVWLGQDDLLQPVQLEIVLLPGQAETECGA